MTSYYYQRFRRVPINCTCLKVTAPDCVRYICFPTIYQNALAWVYFHDKFGRRYVIEAWIDEEGYMIVDTYLLPKALLNPFAGEFDIFFTFENAAENERLYFTDSRFAYSCLTLRIVRTEYSFLLNPNSCYNVQLQKYFCCCQNFTEACPNQFEIDCSNPPYVNVLEGEDVIQQPTQPPTQPEPPNQQPGRRLQPCCYPEDCCFTCDNIISLSNCFYRNFTSMYAMGFLNLIPESGLTFRTVINSMNIVLMLNQGCRTPSGQIPWRIVESPPNSNNFYLHNINNERVECTNVENRLWSEGVSLAGRNYITYGIIFRPTIEDCPPLVLLYPFSVQPNGTEFRLIPNVNYNFCFNVEDLVLTDTQQTLNCRKC